MLRSQYTAATDFFTSNKVSIKYTPEAVTVMLGSLFGLRYVRDAILLVFI